MGLTSAERLYCKEGFEVMMVGNDRNTVRGSFEILPPYLKRHNYGQKLLIRGTIVHLRWGEFSAMESNWVLVSILLFLGIHPRHGVIACIGLKL